FQRTPSASLGAGGFRGFRGFREARSLMRARTRGHVCGRTRERAGGRKTLETRETRAGRGPGSGGRQNGSSSGSGSGPSSSGAMGRVGGSPFGGRRRR